MPINAPGVTDLEASQLLEELGLDDDPAQQSIEGATFAIDSFGVDPFRQSRRMSHRDIETNNKMRQEMLKNENKSKNYASNAQGQVKTAIKAKKVSSLALLKKAKYRPGVETS